MTDARLAEIRIRHAALVNSGADPLLAADIRALLSAVDEEAANARLASEVLAPVTEAARRATDEAAHLRRQLDSVLEERLAADAREIEAAEQRLRKPTGDDTGFSAAPSRYMATGKEAIDVIREELGDAGCAAFCLGNARKYELRAGHKATASAANDLEKASWYRQFEAYINGTGPDPRAYRKESK